MTQIAIASGKGGTGKTTVAVNLAAIFRERDQKVTLIDCDVEEPNAHLFLNPKLGPEKEETLPVPEVDTEKCLGENCRKCVELCRFKCLIWMVDEIMVFPELCHGCGLCELACPVDAIGEGARIIGTTAEGESHGLRHIRGLMRIGEAMSPPLIKAVKARAGDEGIRILDCPPGASCPVVESMSGVDCAVLVAEPTPFGLHDLKIAVDLLIKMGIPFGVVENRAGMGDDRVRDFLREMDIPLLGSLPHSLEAAELYSKGQLLVESLPNFHEEYSRIADAALALAEKGGAR